LSESDLIFHDTITVTHMIISELIGCELIGMYINHKSIKIKCTVNTCGTSTVRRGQLWRL